MSWLVLTKALNIGLIEDILGVKVRSLTLEFEGLQSVLLLFGKSKQNIITKV